jgi:hypothetical protein
MVRNLVRAMTFSILAIATEVSAVADSSCTASQFVGSPCKAECSGSALPVCQGGFFSSSCSCQPGPVVSKPKIKKQSASASTLAFEVYDITCQSTVCAPRFVAGMPLVITPADTAAGVAHTIVGSLPIPPGCNVTVSPGATQSDASLEMSCATFFPKFRVCTLSGPFQVNGGNCPEQHVPDTGTDLDMRVVRAGFEFDTGNASVTGAPTLSIAALGILCLVLVFASIYRMR